MAAAGFSRPKLKLFRKKPDPVFSSTNNGVAGIYLGCNAAGPNGTACPAGRRTVQQGQLPLGTSPNNSTVNNTGSERFGIAVGLGNLRNHLFSISGTGNVTYDALDENPNCGSNWWVGDNFITSSPPPNTSPNPFCRHFLH